MSDITSLVKEIHNSSLFGVIVECGNGCSITNALMSVDGASTTIFESKQPYNKEIQIKNYGESWKRSVSREFIQIVLDVEFKKLPASCNFILVTSFQLANQKTNQLAHGWIGIIYLSPTNSYQSHQYHFTFPFNGSRQDYYKEITLSGLKILLSAVNDENWISSQFVDRISDLHNSNNIYNTLFSGLFNISSEYDNFITITPSGIIRFEDLVRDKPGLILQKGTYNPLHQGHIDLMNFSCNQLPDYASAYLISVNKYDKDSSKLDDLILIIENILQTGSNVVVCKKPLFKENLNWIRQRWTNLKVVFPVGIDTINRIIQTDLDEFFHLKNQHKPTKSNQNIPLEITSYFNLNKEYVYFNTKFLVFKRKNYELTPNIKLFEDLIIFNEEYNDPLAISSTKIRNGEIKNNL